jgi:hypothetical protein
MMNAESFKVMRVDASARSDRHLRKERSFDDTESRNVKVAKDQVV